jgi:hypothetical protein
MSRFTKVNGHILSSAMEFVEDCRSSPLPVGWSVRSKCRPDEQACVEEVVESFSKMNDRVVSKANAAGKGFDDARNINCMRLSMIRELTKNEDEAKSQVMVLDVRNLRSELVDLVVSPIDKLVGDAAIM